MRGERITLTRLEEAIPELGMSHDSIRALEKKKVATKYTKIKKMMQKK